jgi:phosphoglycolate phosphatase-like HAD superfamily hydrolase
MIEKLPCNAVIFDFDGTLADSMSFLEKIGVQVMMKYYDVSKEEATHRYRTTTGLPYEHQIEINFPENERNVRAVEEFEKLKIDRIFEQTLFPDTEDTLKKVVGKGIEMFVSSSTFQPTIIRYFEMRGLRSYFTDILGYKPGFEKGAHHFRYVQQEYGIDPSQLVFVGDSLKDFERSRTFCKFIAISGIFSEKDFRQAGHTGFIVRSLSEVPDLLEKSN